MAAKIAQIDATRCSGCGACIAACKPRLISFETKAWKKTAVVNDIERCSGCALCAARCLIDAVSMFDTVPGPGGFRFPWKS